MLSDPDIAPPFDLAARAVRALASEDPKSACRQLVLAEAEFCSERANHRNSAIRWSLTEQDAALAEAIRGLGILCDLAVDFDDLQTHFAATADLVRAAIRMKSTDPAALPEWRACLAASRNVLHRLSQNSKYASIFDDGVPCGL